MPLVSFLCSTYNNQDTIIPSLYSLLAQDFDDCEIILVNDGSSDATKSVLDNLSDCVPSRKMKIYHRENCGLTNSLNFAYSKSSGTYIARHDLDDFSMPYRLSHQLYTMKRYHLDFCATTSFVNTPRRISPRFLTRIPPKIILPFVNFLTHGTFLLKRSLFDTLNGYNSDFVYAQDYELAYQAYISKSRMGISRTPTYLRSLHGDSISSRFQDKQKNYAELTKRKWRKCLSNISLLMHNNLLWLP